VSPALIDCARCAQHTVAGGWLFGERICGACQMRVRRDPKPCPGCGLTKVIAFLDAEDRRRCATCAAVPAKYACTCCGSEEQMYGRCCGPCTLRERVTVLLTDPTGQIHPQLQPVFEALVGVERAQTVLWWLHHSKGGPDLLRRMAQGEVAISHQAFAGLPASRPVNYIRDLLVAVGSLPAYDAQLERMVPWLETIMAGLPAEQAEVLQRFARWHVMRRLRVAAGRGKLTRGGIQGGRSAINTTVRFLGWLTRNGLTVSALTQGDLDRYLTEQPRCRGYVIEFLSWTERTGLTSGLAIPRPKQAEPDVTLSDDDRWGQIELLLHNETIRLYARVAGLLTLLFAQPLARVVRLPSNHVEQRPDGTVSITFGTSTPVILPEPLDALVVRQLSSRGLSSYPSRADPWLFPGGTPGRHLTTEAVRGQLVAHGIHPLQSRLAALFQLAGQMPTPVLSDLLGISPAAATRWSALAAKDWSRYTANRSTSQRHKARNQ
jgi:hypothetical protein